MARTMKKFSAGGAQGKYDRRMADIKKDFAKDSAGKSGRALEVLEAKRAQRIADAEDDRAKRMGTDRTATRKAEYDAEKNLSRTRKFGAAKPVAAAEPVKVSAPAAETAKAKPKSRREEFNEAFRAARKDPEAMKRGVFTFRGEKFTTKMASEGPKRTVTANPPAAAAAAKNPPAAAAAAKNPPAAAKVKGPSTKTGLNPNSIAGMLARGNFFKTPEEFKKAQEAKYGKAKGGKVKKEKTMNYRAGGSTPPKPSAADRARSKKHLDELKKLKPSAEEGKVVGRANRSEGPGYKKGGSMASCGMKKGGKAATKFGAAMKKKSADTKGRAMVKMASGGSVSKHADGCAVKGKTKGKMLAMGGMARGGAAKMRSRDSYGGAAFKKGGKTC